MARCPLRRAWRRSAVSLLFPLAYGAIGCVVAERPLALPTGDHAAVGVLSAGLGASMREVGRHSWIAARREGSTEWARFENGSVSHGRAPLEDPCPCSRDDRDAREGAVRLHGVVEGDEAARAIVCLTRETQRYDEHYGFWPGPNCNTYVERMVRLCHLGVDLPATAYGKDFRGALGASTTSGGTGVQIESPVVGLKLGLKEGIEVHIVTLPVGVDVWPPALIVPIGPGRIGFDDR